MKTLQQLYNWFFLDTTCANAEISNCKKFLRVAPLEKVGCYNWIWIDKKNFVFAEKNYDWEIEYFHGLKTFYGLKIQTSHLFSFSIIIIMLSFSDIILYVTSMKEILN